MQSIYEGPLNFFNICTTNKNSFLNLQYDDINTNKQTKNERMKT